MNNLATYIRAQVEQTQTPGLTVAVAKNGQLTYQESFGYRDREAELPYTIDTVGGLGSIGKTFTAVAILQLQEAGLLSVHDPVTRYLPQFRTPDPEASKAITLHHLLTHTSGLPDLPFFIWSYGPSILADPTMEGSAWYKIAAAGQPITSTADHLRLLADHPYTMLAAPGQVMSYSNDGYALLGAVVEAVSGRPYAEYIIERIVRPAGMTSFATEAKTAQAGPDVATRYTNRMVDGGWQMVRSPLWWEDPVLQGAGSVHNGSARDLLRFTEIFRTGGLVDGVRLLREQSVAAMLYPHAPIPPDMAYGYGLLIQPDFHGTTVVGHTGNLKGVGNVFWYLPEFGMTAVAMGNFMGAPAGSAAQAALRSAMGLAPDEPPATYPEYDCPPEQLPAYVGTYPGPGTPVVVSMVDGRLHFSMGGPPDPLRPI